MRSVINSQSVAVGLLLLSCTTEDPRAQYSRPHEREVSEQRGAPDGSVESRSSRDSSVGSDDASTAVPSDGGGARPAARRDASTEVLENDDAGATSAAATCGEAPVIDKPFSRKVLRQAAVSCAAFRFCEFEGVAMALKTAVDAQAAKPTSATLNRARDAWHSAMESWSEVELFQFGPLSSRAISAGRDIYHGEGIRDRIYSWPLASRCRVEEQLVSQDYKKDLESSLVSGRGLFALEYLLFYEGDDTDCPALSAAGAAWSKLSTSQIDKRKRAYAKAIAADIASQVQTLRDVYEPGGDYHTAFTDAEGYPNEQEAMNVLAWSLAYLEKEVKDYKLGVPAGFILNSAAVAESPFAGAGSSNIRANLRGFRSLFQGYGSAGQGIGFDDWLISAEHDDLSRDMIGALDAAEKVVGELPALEEATPAELEEAYKAVKALTDLLKAEFFGAGSPLNLKLPATVEGDTD